MNPRHLLSRLLSAVAIAMAMARAETPPPLGASMLRAFVEELRTNHPIARAARLRAAAAGTNTLAVRTWEDPMLTANGAPYTVNEAMRRDNGDVNLGVEQRLPLFGKAAAARDLARAGADRERALSDETFLRLRRDLLQALVALAGAEELLQLGREDLVWLDVARTQATESFRSGAASQAEVLRFQNDHARQHTRLAGLERSRDHARVVVHRALHREPDRAVPAFRLPDPAPAPAFDPRLVALARDAAPRLAVLHRELREAEATREVTRRSQRPDIALGVEGNAYAAQSTLNMALVSVRLNLPWFNRSKYRADLARDDQRARAARLEIDGERAALSEALHGLTMRLANARDTALLNRDEILPRSALALDAAFAAWTARRGSFLELLDARRQKLEAQAALIDAVVTQHQDMADLLFLTGHDSAEDLQTILTR
jgi:outer membrane protein, heavy metal efflux system